MADDPFKDGAIVMKLGDEGFGEGEYESLGPDEQWQTYTDIHGWPFKVKPTSDPDKVYAGFMPRLPSPGRYAIEVFVPNEYTESQSIRYFVVYYDESGQRQEKKVALDQSIYNNVWVSLGYYHLDQSLGDRDAGRVNLTDFSIEHPPKLFAVAAMRWRPVTQEDIVVQPAPAPAVQGGGLDWPIGTPEERAVAATKWPGFWNDANPYGSTYKDSAGNTSYHTGSDLNLNKPSYNLDKGKPIYALNSGVVTFSGRAGNYWLNLVVIEHDPPPGGPKFFARYAHVQNMRVNAGDRVQKGQQICEVGTSGGDFGNYHLHFDISTTELLKSNPRHWPGGDVNSLHTNYVDPKAFIVKYRGG